MPSSSVLAVLAPVRWLRACTELVLPRACAGCGAVGTWWCEECAPALRAPPVRCDVGWVGGRVDGAVVCHAVAPYHGAAGAAIVALKERGADALRAPLSAALARAARSSLVAVDARGSPIALVPAPSRPAAVRRRGADVLAGLARDASVPLREEGRDVLVVPALCHARSVADQADLSARSRAANLAGALRVRSSARGLLDGRVVVVVDDVTTTGATLTEAARAIVSAVPEVRISAATVAATRVELADGLVRAGRDD